MGNDLRLSSAKTPDGLDKAFASAKKALSLTGISMRLKKPDEAKVTAKMTKTGEPAEFMLSCSGERVTLTVECGGAEVMELGEMSLDIAKRGKAALEELDALVAEKVITKAEADKLKAGAAPDTKDLRKEIAELKKQIAEDEKIQTYDDAKKDRAFFVGFTDYCERERSEEGLAFLAAVEKKTKRELIIAQFIGPKAKTQVNISDKLADAVLAGADFKDAVVEVKKLLKSDTLKRFREKLVAQSEKQLDKLEAQLKALG